MKHEEFKKGIKQMQEVRLTDADKSAMLKRVFSTPIKSPYVRHAGVFGIFQKPLAFAITFILFVVMGGSLAYTAEASLPGETLYHIKTRVVEPIIDSINISPIKKLEWEEKKVERRIMEAEKLAEKNELDEDKTRELERKIEKSSVAFAKAAEASASSTATSTQGHKEKVEKLKQGFRDKLNEKKEESGEEDERKEKKIERLKDSAVKALESKEGRKEERKRDSENSRDDD